MNASITVRPIVFTDSPERWRTLLHALGGVDVVTVDGWAVLALGSGRVGLHSPDAEYPAGSCRLALETTDLAGFEQRVGDGVARAGGRLERVEPGHGPALRVTGPDGLTFPVDSVEQPDAAGGGDVTVAPLWMTHDVPGGAGLLEALGLRRRTASDSGIWVDLRADRGLMAVHAIESDEPTPTPHAVLGLEHEDVDALAELLRAAGVEGRVIDESYGRSLRLDHPDGGGAQIWVNETMTDLYGYSRAEGEAG